MSMIQFQEAHLELRSYIGLLFVFYSESIHKITLHYNKSLNYRVFNAGNCSNAKNDRDGHNLKPFYY